VRAAGNICARQAQVALVTVEAASDPSGCVELAIPASEWSPTGPASWSCHRLGLLGPASGHVSGYVSSVGREGQEPPLMLSTGQELPIRHLVALPATIMNHW
jgi:hypothetical protein